MNTLVEIHPDDVLARRNAAIRTLFETRSLAIVGATADTGKLGSAPLQSMATLGYQGKISAVNPRYDTLMGHGCYKSVDELPDDVDCVMITLPAAGAVDVAEACVARGINSIVMIPQGFGEAGPEGAARDARLLKLAQQGVAIVGPNTNGISNVALGLAMSVGPVFQYAGRVKPGRVSVVSQSGAMISSILTRLNQCGLGIGKTATCGNELVLTVADYLDYLVDDPDTDVIVLYLETIRDMAAFRRSLARARAAGKPIAAIKVGSSEGGQKATLCHTGAIAGSYRNTIAFLESEGLYVADDIETLATLTELLVRHDWSDETPANRFIASISGGFAALTADVMERLGMPLADPTPAGVAALEAIPNQSHAVNPYDIAARNEFIPQVIDTFRADGFNQLIFGMVLLKPEINELVAGMLIEARQRGMDKLFVVSPSVDPAEQKRYNDAGMVLTDNVPALMKALGAIETHRRNAVLRRDHPAIAGVAPAIALPATPGLVDEARSKALIESAGIRVPQSVVRPVADGPGDLSGLSRPLVMKGVSDTIAHKSEHGLVALGLASDAEIAEAWERVRAALAVADPAAGSILIEEMIGGGLEAILGVQRDPIVGPVVVVGAGGILVELLDDAVVLVPPFSVAEARDAILRTRLGKLMTGYRGRHFDVDALAVAAARLGDVALAEPRLDSLDVNPVLVQPGTSGVIAVDAKIVVTA